ncbi:hypothetical protein [Caproiciproducens faecalis]|uniref:Uncharacterized protein n=1 Tax=Caproiciproducens faecalis TaxID=2820301 RepID=A0ABS7DKQ2_9FIRM|nr:hypothetical protein [Caproiciproducens faecalis]MBW7571870.1 hypothetical protein [Caproiciproducens faecalis]
MTHDEHCNCGCGHEHPRKADTNDTPVEVTESQREFLHQLHHRHYLPVARFTVTDSREVDFVSTALAPVFLCSASDDMKTVKEAGAFLQNLEDLGLITLDYDIPLNGYDYEEYKESALYAYFRETVAEGATRPNFLGNTPVLELGSIALTEAGEQIAAAHCGHDHDHQFHG